MKINITKQNLRDELNFMKKSKLNGVPGIYKIDSGTKGPTFGLTVCTHGNEISGLAVTYYLRKVFKLNEKLTKGSVIIAVNNLKAAGKSIKAKSEKERLATRFIDLNFNRLPKNLLKIKSDSRYEAQRAKELYPVWSLFDYAMDIHSTVQNNPPIIIAPGNLDYNLVKDFPIETIVTNIDKVQIGAPAFSFYGGNRKIQTIEIESGQHDRKKSRVTAIECTLSLLEKLDMIQKKSLKSKSGSQMRVLKEYCVYDSVVFPDEQCVLGRIFRDFEYIKEGEILAKINGKEIKARKDSCILMAPKGLKPAKVGEEAVFLSQPVKNIKI